MQQEILIEEPLNEKLSIKEIETEINQNSEEIILEKPPTPQTPQKRTKCFLIVLFLLILGVAAAALIPQDTEILFLIKHNESEYFFNT